MMAGDCRAGSSNTAATVMKIKPARAISRAETLTAATSATSTVSNPRTVHQGSLAPSSRLRPASSRATRYTAPKTSTETKETARPTPSGAPHAMDQG